MRLWHKYTRNNTEKFMIQQFLRFQNCIVEGLQKTNSNLKEWMWFFYLLLWRLFFNLSVKKFFLFLFLSIFFSEILIISFMLATLYLFPAISACRNMHMLYNLHVLVKINATLSLFTKVTISNQFLKSVSKKDRKLWPCSNKLVLNALIAYAYTLNTL